MEAPAGVTEDQADGDAKGPDSGQEELDAPLPLDYGHDADGKVVPLEGVQSLFLTGTAPTWQVRDGFELTFPRYAATRMPKLPQRVALFCLLIAQRLAVHYPSTFPYHMLKLTVSEPISDPFGLTGGV